MGGIEVLTASEMLSEPIVVPDTFVSGISHLEDLGDGNFRVVLYARQHSPYGGEDFVIVAKLIMPSSAIINGINTAKAALSYKCSCGVMTVTH